MNQLLLYSGLVLVVGIPLAVGAYYAGRNAVLDILSLIIKAIIKYLILHGRPMTKAEHDTLIQGGDNKDVRNYDLENHIGEKVDANWNRITVDKHPGEKRQHEDHH